MWPLFVNYSLETWILEKEEYLKQASNLKAPVLFVNSICQSVRALGGCYLFSNNKIESTLELGCEGTLIVEI